MRGRRRPLSVGVVAPLVAPLSDAHPYGNQHFLADLARGLGERGHAVVVYAAAGSRVPGVRVETVDVLPAARRRFVLLRDNAPGESRAMAHAFAALFARLRRNGHDVVSQHAFDREALTGSAGVPVLHTLHLPPMRSDMIEAVRACDGAVASVSNTCAALWREALGRDVVALPNGVPDFEAAPAGVVEDVAIVAGRISAEKGTAIAIRAARAAGLRPLVVGEVYDADYFARDVLPLLGSDVVDTLARHELARRMARAAVTLMPIAWDEPFGLVAAESRLAGCPVVGYRRGALPEVVEDGVGGWLVDPDDEEALVPAIRRARRLDRAALRAVAARRFSMDACVTRYEAALERIACAA